MIAALAFLRTYHRPLIAVALLLALMWALNRYVADAVHDDRVDGRNAALEADSKADDVAGVVAASEQAKTEKENNDAREAAARSDDPLGDGLRSLRNARRDP